MFFFKSFLDGRIFEVVKDGFIQQIRTPTEVFNDPSNLFVAGFIGTPQMNFLDASLEKDAGANIMLNLKAAK